MSKFQEELAKRRKDKEAQEAAETKAVSGAAAEILSIYGDGTRTNNWYGKATPGHISAPSNAVPGGGSPTVTAAPPSEVPNWDEFIPDIPDFQRNPYDDQLDAIVRQLPITAAYRRWIGKGEPQIRYEGQRESIMIRCPFPAHVDEEPSAWCNTDKNVWYCNPCNYGGDIYDLAAIHFGLPVPQYKKNGMFPKLRQLMAGDFGLQVVRGVNGTEYLVQSNESTVAVPAAPTPTPAPKAPQSRVFDIPGFTSIPMPGSKPQSHAPPQAPVGLGSTSNDAVTPAPTLTPTPPTRQVAANPVESSGSVESSESATNSTDPQSSTVAVHPTVPAQGLQPAQVAASNPFSIPGFTPMSFGINGAGSVSPATTASIPGQAQQAASTSAPSTVPQMLPPAMLGFGFGVQLASTQAHVVEPDDETLAEYGLTSEGEEDGSGGFSGTGLPWQTLTPSGTFLDQYMNLTTKDEAPEEYHYFSALLALSMATGQDVRLFDRHPVKGNIFVCLLGRTGDGKSNAKGYLNQLLIKAMPYDHDDPVNKGVLRVGNPGSSEFMVKQFMKQIRDVNNPGLPPEKVPVRGLIEFEELATLMKRSNSPSSTLAQFLIEFYDAKGDVQTGSLTHGGFVATDPFASTLSTTQPRTLRDIITSEHVTSGFLNRWIFATGRPKEGDPIGGEILNIDPLIQPLRQVFAWAAGVNSVIQWEPAARRLAGDFIIDVIRPIKKADDGDLFARIDLLFKKLILLNTVNLQRNSVPAEAVEWAKGAFSYILGTYRSLDKAVHNNVDQELRQSIIKTILSVTRKTGRPPSMRQIADAIGTRKFTGDQIVRCVQTMEKLGQIIEIPPGTGPGRKATRYALAAKE